MYQEAYKMIQSGNVNQAGLQKMYNSFSKQYEKDAEKTQADLSKQYADFAYNRGVENAKNSHYLDAIDDYNTAIRYKPSFEAYANKGCSQYALGEYKDALESFNKALEFQPNNQTIIDIKATVQNQISKMEAAPIAIYDLKIANTDQEGNIITDYGLPIYSENTYYLRPKIYYKSNVKSKVTLQIKFINPDGSISKSGTSPEGYSTKSDVITDGNGSRKLHSWGSKTKGNWSSGQYRLEIWYEDVCIASKNFFVLSAAYNANSNFSIPTYVPTSNNGNSGTLTLKRKTCSSCNGTGTDPYPTSVASYGLDNSSPNKCPVCGKYENHYHKSCIPCQGKGYIESY